MLLKKTENNWVLSSKIRYNVDMLNDADYMDVTNNVDYMCVYIYIHSHIHMFGFQAPTYEYLHIVDKR